MAGFGISIVSVLLGDLIFLKYILFVVFVLPYAVFVFVAIWRCAFNTEYPFFGYLARGYLVLAGLSAIGLF